MPRQPLWDEPAIAYAMEPTCLFKSKGKSEVTAWEIQPLEKERCIMGDSECFPLAVQLLKRTIRKMTQRIKKDGYYLLSEVLRNIPRDQGTFSIDFSEDSVITLVRHQAIHNQELEIALEPGERGRRNQYWIRMNEMHRDNHADLRSLGLEVNTLSELWPWCHVTTRANLNSILEDGLQPGILTRQGGSSLIHFGLHGLPMSFLGKRRYTQGRIIIYPDYRKLRQRHKFYLLPSGALVADTPKIGREDLYAIVILQDHESWDDSTLVYPITIGEMELPDGPCLVTKAGKVLTEEMRIFRQKAIPSRLRNIQKKACKD